MSLTACGTLSSSGEQQALAGVLADPALADREVDDVRRVAGGERVVQVVLEGGLVVFPVDLDARIGRLEAGDRVLDVLVEGRRQVERPEADLGVRLDALDHRLGRIGREGLGAGARGRRALGRRGALGRGAGGGGRGRRGLAGRRRGRRGLRAGADREHARRARGPGTCVSSSCVAPLLRSCQRTSMPVTAAGIPPAVRGRGVSRAITSSRCTGGRLEEGPALVSLPGRHLPSLDRRGPGPSRHRSGGRAREDHGSPSAGIGVRGQEMDDIGWQRLAGELGSRTGARRGRPGRVGGTCRRRPPRRRRGRRGARRRS